MLNVFFIHTILPYNYGYSSLLLREVRTGKLGSELQNWRSEDGEDDEHGIE